MMEDYLKHSSDPNIDVAIDAEHKLQNAIQIVTDFEEIWWL